MSENWKLVFCTADKESVVVILNKTDYTKKIMVNLKDIRKKLELEEIKKYDYLNKIKNSIQRKFKRC